jgi:hypothetical protein
VFSEIKDEKERELVEYLTEYWGVTDEAIITKQPEHRDKPDFIIEVEGQTIGVELTEAIDPLSASSKTAAIQIRDNLKTDRKLTEKILSSRLYVRVDLDNSSYYNKDEITLITEQIKELVLNYREDEASAGKLWMSKIGTKDEKVSVIYKSLTVRPNIRINSNHSVDSERNLVFEAIKKKTSKNKDWKKIRQSYDRLVLLVHEHLHVSNPSRAKELLKTESFVPYDEVWYLYPLPKPSDGKVYQLWKRGT